MLIVIDNNKKKLKEIETIGVHYKWMLIVVYNNKKEKKN
jgi:hypothetical protein